MKICKLKQAVVQVRFDLLQEISQSHNLKILIKNSERVLNFILINNERFTGVNQWFKEFYFNFPRFHHARVAFDEFSRSCRSYFSCISLICVENRTQIHGKSKAVQSQEYFNRLQRIPSGFLALDVRHCEYSLKWNEKIFPLTLETDFTGHSKRAPHKVCHKLRLPKRPHPDRRLSPSRVVVFLFKNCGLVGHGELTVQLDSIKNCLSNISDVFRYFSCSERSKVKVGSMDFFINFLNKLLSLFDFLIVTFLHVYHHTATAFNSWVYLKFIPGKTNSWK